MSEPPLFPKRLVVFWLTGYALLVANIVWVAPGKQFMAGMGAIAAAGVAGYIVGRLRPARPVSRTPPKPPFLLLLGVMVVAMVGVELVVLAFGTYTQGWLVISTFIGIQAWAPAARLWDRRHPQVPSTAS